MANAKKLKIMLLLSTPLIGIFLHSNVSATTCSDVTESYNYSIFNACNNRRSDSSIRYGAMWVSDTNEAQNVKSGINSSTSSGSIRVFVRGLLIGSNVGAEVGTNYVKFVKTTPNNIIRHSAINNYPAYAPLTLDGTSFLRIEHSLVSTLSASFMGATLNIDELTKSGNYDSKTTNGGNTIYTVYLQAYRCANGFSPATSSGTPGNCFSDPTALIISIPNIITRKLTYNANGGTGAPSAQTCTATGSSACSVTVSSVKPTRTGYTFLGWADSASATSINHQAGKVISLTSDKTIYAVWKKNQNTLTAYAAVLGTFDSTTNKRTMLKSDGTTIPNVTINESRGKVWSNTTTVDYNTSATVTTSGFNPAGYSWSQWGSSCNSATTRNCTIKNLTNNTDVVAYYERNSFQGHAYVSNTPDFGNGTSRAQTGWVSNDKDVSTEIDCPNNGCSVYFWLKLLTVAGSGKTSYQYGKQINNGTVNWLPSSTTYYNIAPSKVKDGQNATYIRGASGNGQNEPLNPGDKICYYLKFKPYGSLSNDTYKTISACATAKETTFKGKSNISGATSSNMDYQSANKTITSTISNCSSINGCKVSFSHWLKRGGSSGATAYTISRTSNLTGDDRGIENDRGIQNNSNLKSGTFDSSEAEVFNSGTLTLYPGMVVCETLKFKTSNTSSGKDVSTTVCASALGKAQPDPGEDGSNAFIKIEVKNNNVKKYNTFGHIVYAKPGDELTYRATYDPILQYTYYLIPQKMRINGGTIYPTSGTNSTSSLGTMFDLNKGSLNGWNNAFSIQRKFSSQEDNFDGASTLSNYTYGNGNTEKRNEQHDYNVSSSNIGISIGERAITNLNDTTKTTPKQVTFENDNNTNRGNVDTGTISSTAFARIPYNFILNSEISDPEGENIVYAGEKTTIHYNINLKPKKNCETSDDCGEYTTHVSNPEIRLIVYYPTDGPSIIPGISSWGDSNTNDLCSYYGLTNNNQNSCSHEKAYNNLSISKSIENSEATFYVKDLNAGSNVCVAIANYPSTSGADTNWNDSEGNHRWSISESVCYTVAKKPSIQIWGGNVYSRNKINTATSIKNHLSGVTADYNMFNKNSTNYVFGSWGELGVIAGNTVTGFASGATMGYEQNNNGALLPNPQGENGNNSGIVGGNKEDSNKTLFCNRVPLSFANSECSQTSTPGIGTSTPSNSIKQDKESIVAKFMKKGDANASGTINLNDETSYYYGKNNELTIPESTIGKGVRKVVHSDKDIIIDGNITYDASDSYTLITDVPKLVIYGKNIKISCEVGNIDAILIADENVTTCYESDDINDWRNSKQLKINGAVIANSLIPNRTYGAATGANSIVPAEIINFDPSLYMWGGDNTDNEEQKVDAFNIVYTSEVSTRF